VRLVVTGGGTGGHLFPGIAVACGMRDRLPGTTILFIGTSRQVDRIGLEGLGFRQAVIRSSGLKGMGTFARLRALAQLPLAVFQAARILGRFRPDLVLGVGGYVTGPVLLAAKLRGTQVCIHEQNSVPGLANRLAGRIADRIFISLPCGPSFPGARTRLTGNPVRGEILAAADRRRPRPSDRPPTLLVLGGSQGAHMVNSLVVAAVERMVADGGRLRVIHQTGRRDLDMVRRAYAKLELQAETADFFRDMASVYLQADLVVSRAGATTLAELAVMGLPVLLIPYPHAADNHQERNGRWYAEGGGAVLLQESLLNGNILAEEITTLLYNDQNLQVMGSRMRTLARPEATERIIDQCLELVQTRGR